MAERSTHELETPSGKKLVLKDYITARERNAIRSVLTAEVSVTATGPQLKELKEGLLDRAERVLIENVVVSYDGAPESIVDRLLDSSPAEYDFVNDAAGKIADFKKAN